tara:strand:+ start:25466 stop:27487 length:2022 start_codon:yes stop_codon:yes gene_type:complete
MIYLPKIKPKNFCPNPIAKFGIPDYANSIIYPEVENTQAWRSWWKEQYYYCIEGYETAGLKISGRLYYYLNFCIIAGVSRGNIYPEYYDLVHEFYDLIEQAKAEGKGVIGLKARRKGFSYNVMCGEIDYGMRFIDGYQAGVCGGAEEHVSDFYNKLINQFFLKPPELKMHLMSKGSVESEVPMVSGYKVKTNTGWEERGSKNTIYWSTMYRNPNKFKGKYLHAQVFEESGEFPLLEKAYNASKDCWMEGDMMIGTPYVYGTGGNVKSNSRDFKKMYYDPDAYRLLKFFVPATRMYFPCVAGYKNSKGEIKEDIPYLKDKYTIEERYGMEDREAAEEKILARREDFKKGDNKKALYDNMQNNPLDEKESFLQFSSNNFDVDMINEQMFKIESQKTKLGKFKLEWKKNEKGELLTPLKVEPVPDKNGDWKIHYDGHPKSRYKNLDVAGLDSYDMDQSMTSKSLGSMVIYRRSNTMSEEISDAPIALLYYRPKQKETFYDECLKAAVYWNLVGNVLIDAEKSLIIEYWKNHGGLKYLAPRPRKFDAPGGKQIHDLGVKLTTYSKPKMLGVIQSWVYDYVDKCWFPEILQDLLDYDETTRESDWDAADALGIALMRNSDMQIKITDDLKIAKDDPYKLPEWGEDSEGNAVMKKGGTIIEGDVKDPFLQMLYSGQLNS